MEKKTEHKKKRSQRDYSLSFKLQLIGELERGELNFSQATKKYGIQGHTTVSKWLRKYSTLETSVEFKKMSEEKEFIIGGKLNPKIKAKEITNWLKEEFELGHGYAMAIYATFKGKTE